MKDVEFPLWTDRSMSGHTVQCQIRVLQERNSLIRIFNVFNLCCIFLKHFPIVKLVKIYIKTYRDQIFVKIKVKDTQLSERTKTKDSFIQYEEINIIMRSAPYIVFVYFEVH